LLFVKKLDMLFVMTVEEYCRKKQASLDEEKIPRAHCSRCRNPQRTCYCAFLEPFSCGIQFVILISRGESRRSIATGRMAHLSLANSLLIEGQDFTHNTQIAQILEDPDNYPMVLYPGKNARCLNRLSSEEKKTFFPPGKRPVLFIIDGTWAQAKRMVRLSRNLQPLPHFFFEPTVLSGFQVRQQPKTVCYSTIEAIHYVIDFFEGDQTQKHHALLDAFKKMVQRQVALQQHYIRFNLPRLRDAR
jgi:DTW domain-containing protein YfiP